MKALFELIFGIIILYGSIRIGGDELLKALAIEVHTKITSGQRSLETLNQSLSGKKLTGDARLLEGAKPARRP